MLILPDNASVYDIQVAKLISTWETPKRSWLYNAKKYITKPISFAGNVVLKTPGIGHMLQSTFNKFISLCNDIGTITVRKEAIIKEYNKAFTAYKISTIDDIANLSLEMCDNTVGYLAAKYKILAAFEGATFGIAGLPGILADIPAVIIIALRAIGEYAIYYGFDIEKQAERLYALQVLNFAGGGLSQVNKLNRLLQLEKLAHNIGNHTWKELSKDIFVRIIQECSESVGIRLTKRKLAQVVPVAGSAIGAGLNVRYISQVCDTAHHLYRKRFLERKYNIFDDQIRK